MPSPNIHLIWCCGGTFLNHELLYSQQLHNILLLCSTLFRTLYLEHRILRPYYIIYSFNYLYNFIIYFEESAVVLGSVQVLYKHVRGGG